MLKSSARSAIRLRGVRHNNLKNFDLDLPLNQLIVVTGLSGSGKSSLAFDTLFAEGQRRYIETFSPYARQFLDRMDKPKVDHIEGIPPAIAIEQRNAVRTTRSTVGTMTEVCDYMKVLWPHVAQLHCRQCGRRVRKEPSQYIWETLKQEQESTSSSENPEFLVTFDVPLSEKLSLEDSLALIARQGYQRLLTNGSIVRLDELSLQGTKRRTLPQSLTVVQDRLRLNNSNRARFVEACDQAYHFGKGKLTIWEINPPSVIVRPRLFSNRLHCAQCDLEYRDASPALFSFNNPQGACPACRGFGRVISIDYDLVMPDRSKTLAQGVVKPWLTGTGAESQEDLMRACRQHEVPTDVPFNKLAKKWQNFVIDGEPDYGIDEEHHWPRAWYGVKGYFRWLESRAYKMHVRVLLSRYRAYTPCPTCHGKRFQPEALLYRVRRQEADDRRQEIGNESQESGVRRRESEAQREEPGLTLADFYQLTIREALVFIENLVATHRQAANDPVTLALNEVQSRLGYLAQVGLGYLTLDRPTRSLSGGETERVNLTTCLGTRLVNTLFVLDEPSVGLHPRDTDRLVRILQQLRNAGNTVLVVEHEASVMRSANLLIDLGPGHGASGGQVVFQGTYAQILKSKESLTGQYLSGRRQIDLPLRRPVTIRPQQPPFSPDALSYDAYALNDARSGTGVSPEFRSARGGFTLPIAAQAQEESTPSLKLAHATKHNLKDLSLSIPLRRFVCVTGVSGSGKSTLVREVLLPTLAEALRSELAEVKASDRLVSDPEEQEDGSDETEDDAASNPSGPLQISGHEQIGRVILVDQSILAKTPRSNPAVYIGAFDDIREFFAQSDLAMRRGLNASAFSFNSAQGQCERCRGAGFEKIEMQFLSDVFILCPDCDGRRYRAHILEVRVGRPEAGSQEAGARSRPAFGIEQPAAPLDSASIADLLDSTVDEVIDFLAAFPQSKPAGRAMASLKLLQEVGLGYLKLGQPINTLSGGESQRLKLVKHLAEAGLESEHSRLQKPSMGTRGSPERMQPLSSTLFLFDEPTTGLHFEDVRVLLKVFQRLVDAGHSVVVIEHNLDVIKSADWLIDLGPDAGDQGGKIVAQGTPDYLAGCDHSHTGRALREVLQPMQTVPA